MDITIRTFMGEELSGHYSRLESYIVRGGPVPLSRHPRWLDVLGRGLRQTPFGLEARVGEKTCGWLPLLHIRSLVFGRFLVSMPYLNYGGVQADHQEAASALVDRAVELADQLRTRYLELRQEHALEHPALVQPANLKVHMHLALPPITGELWDRLTSKVRNQVRKAERMGLTTHWGREELLSEFYHVYAHNMRDLGTPAYSKKLFRCVLKEFPERAELAVIRDDSRALASGLLLHGWKMSEVPTAGSLRDFRHTNANMLLYWRFLEQAVQRGQEIFDFGRSSPDSNTFRFKKQWGALPRPAKWQYYVRRGGLADMRLENPKYQRLIRIWQRLPVGLTRLIGPWIVRGIP